jgi:hypothetical protein
MPILFNICLDRVKGCIPIPGCDDNYHVQGSVEPYSTIQLDAVQL